MPCSLQFPFDTCLLAVDADVFKELPCGAKLDLYDLSETFQAYLVDGDLIGSSSASWFRAHGMHDSNVAL